MKNQSLLAALVLLAATGAGPKMQSAPVLRDVQPGKRPRGNSTSPAKRLLERQRAKRAKP